MRLKTTFGIAHQTAAAQPEPIVIAAALFDQLQIGVIQKEDPIQVLPRQTTVEPAIRSRLRIRQDRLLSVVWTLRGVRTAVLPTEV